MIMMVRAVKNGPSIGPDRRNVSHLQIGPVVNRIIRKVLNTVPIFLVRLILLGTIMFAPLLALVISVKDDFFINADLYMKRTYLV